jgi:hypothetical protein
MTVHLVKLCVGVETVQDLRQWQAERLRTLACVGKTPELCHRTMQAPRRRAEVLDGGSLYWVIRGVILVRQRILDLRADTKDDGTACCGIVLDPELVTTRPHPRRAFQGWRYLDTADAPADARTLDEADDGMPPGMREDLRALGLIDW